MNRVTHFVRLIQVRRAPAFKFPHSFKAPSHMKAKSANRTTRGVLARGVSRIRRSVTVPFCARLRSLHFWIIPYRCAIFTSRRFTHTPRSHISKGMETRQFSDVNINVRRNMTLEIESMTHLNLVGQPHSVGPTLQLFRSAGPVSNTNLFRRFHILTFPPTVICMCPTLAHSA